VALRLFDSHRRHLVGLCLAKASVFKLGQRLFIGNRRHLLATASAAVPIVSGAISIGVNSLSSGCVVFLRLVPV